MKSIPIAIAVLVVMVGVYAAGNLTYSLNIIYDKGVLQAGDLGLVEGVAPDRTLQPEQGYTLQVVSFGGDTLYSFKFTIGLTILAEPPPGIFNEKGEQIVIPETSPRITERTEIVLIIPYFENAKSLDILDQQGTRVLSVDVSKYSKPRARWQLYAAIAALVIAVGSIIWYKRRAKRAGVGI